MKKISFSLFNNPKLQKLQYMGWIDHPTPLFGVARAIKRALNTNSLDCEIVFTKVI